MTQSVFNDIDLHITAELMQAQFCIRAAVAWCTDPNILRVLSFVLTKGVSVELIVNDDKINKKMDYSSLISKGGKIYFADGSSDIMHHKFCIIDDIRVISGSYNWTSHAKSNDEQITIIEDDKEEIDKFILRFDDLMQNITEKIKKHSEATDKLHQRPLSTKMNIDVSDIIPTKQTRLTRTFTLSPEVDDQLDEASRRLKTPRSTILEKAFVAWWNAVQKTLS